MVDNLGLEQFRDFGQSKSNKTGKLSVGLFFFFFFNFGTWTYMALLFFGCGRLGLLFVVGGEVEISSCSSREKSLQRKDLAKIRWKKVRVGQRFRLTAPMRQGGKLNPFAVSSN